MSEPVYSVARGLGLIDELVGDPYAGSHAVVKVVHALIDEVEQLQGEVHWLEKVEMRLLRNEIERLQKELDMWERMYKEVTAAP